MEQTRTDQNATRQVDQIVECGIDLGTTNSLCAWVRRVDPRQTPSLVFDFALHCSSRRPESKQRIIPSVVGRRADTDELLVGLDAIDNEALNPCETVRSIKRLMARRFDDPEVTRLRRVVRYSIDRDEAGMAVVILGKRAYSPTELSALILRRVKADAEATFGVTVTHAVVSVPAYFTVEQRSATREAARLAGLQTKRIVSEPVAASSAIAPEGRGKVLVFDMGGGTLDITVVRQTMPLPFTLAHQGDMWMGGDDVDARLAAAKGPEVQRAFGLDLADAASAADFAAEIRRAKEVVCSSGRDKEQIFGARQASAREPNAAAVFLTRTDVETACRSDIRRAMDLVTKTLSGGSISTREIDRVLLVGGSSGLPGVREGMAQIFPAERIHAVDDPLSAVALGCGVLARAMCGVECRDGHLNDESALLCATCGLPLGGSVDCTPMAIGVEVQGGGFEVVIPKASRYRKSFSRVFYTSEPAQTRLYLPVYEGESERAAQNSLEGYVVVLLPFPAPVDTPVEISMTPDPDGVLAITLKCRDYTEEALLKPGDWSTSLRTELERHRSSGGAVEVVEAEALIAVWQTVPPNTPEQEGLAAKGRKLLESFRSREWDYAQAGARFLQRVNGEIGGIGYLCAVGAAAAAAVKLALRRYHEFLADGPGPGLSRAEVSSSIWGAVDALYSDPAGFALFLILVWGDPDSADPDHRELAKDRSELDAIFALGPDGCERASEFLNAVAGRPHAVRVARISGGGQLGFVKTGVFQTRDAARGR